MTHTTTTRRRGSWTALAMALIAGPLAALALTAPAASARTTTLHLFGRTTARTFVDPHGHPISSHGPPAAGSTFDFTGVDYVGNHKHHAAKATGSDHLRCTILPGGGGVVKGRCSGQIALGGSMLLASDETITLSDSASPLRINGGTGVYAHARGMIIPTNVGNDTDFTIRITR
jgi:hypothetical protein